MSRKKLEIHLEGPGFPDEAMRERLQAITSHRYGDTVVMRISCHLSKRRALGLNKAGFFLSILLMKCQYFTHFPLILR